MNNPILFLRKIKCRKEIEMEATQVIKKTNLWLILIPALALVVLMAFGVFTVVGSSSGGKVLTQDLSESVGDATSARYEIHTGTGNLTIDPLPAGQPLLASGTLEYLERQGRPTGSVEMNKGLYTLTLKANGGLKQGFRLPWAACNGETDWQIHLNPNLPADIQAASGGGNIQLNLAGMVVTRLATETGGGNVEVVLPDKAANLTALAKTGGGNVTVVIGGGMTGSSRVTATSGAGSVLVRLPAGIAARIRAKTGMGKLEIDPHFTQIDDHTYQSPDFPTATARIEITVESGAGNVTVSVR